MFVEEGKNDFSDDDDPYEVSSPEYVLSNYNIDKKTRL